MSESDLKERETAIDPDAFEKEFGDKFSDDEKSKLDDLSDQVGKGFTGPTNSGAQKKNKKLLIGGGVVAGVGVTGAFAFFALLPLKINHIVNNVQDRFFTSAESATDRWSEKLFTKYITSKVLPGMKGNCTTGSVNRSCINVSASDTHSPVGRLYNGWKDAHFENKLADNYGIEFEKNNTTYSMKVKGVEMIKAGSIGELETGMTGGRKEVRRAYRDAMKEETFFKKALFRFKVGNLLERKYGIRRCIFACDTRDNFADWKDRKKDGYKIKLIERVVTPRSEVASLVLQCIVTGGCEAPGGTSPDGERRDVFQQRVDAKLTELASKIGQEAVTDLIASADLISQKGFGRYLIEKITAKITNEATGELAGKAVPIVGWIDTIADLVKKVNTLGPSLKKMGYITNAGVMVASYMSYRTMADEMKTGNVDPELLGSMVTSLSGNEAGGSAEASPMYQKVVGGGATQTAFSGLFPKAYAAEEKSGYICNDGSKASASLPICPEDSLKTSSFVTNLADFLTNNPLNDSLRQISNIWYTDIAGVSPDKAYSAVGNVISGITDVLLRPVMDRLTGILSSWGGLEKLTQNIMDFLIPSPFPSEPDKKISGAKNASVMIGGGDVAGNDFTQLGLGGREITSQELADIRNELEQEHQASFASMSIKDRVLSTENNRSLISRVAMTVPVDTSNTVAGNAVATIVRSPFSVLNNFSSFINPKRVHAAIAEDDAYGIKQYGIPANDPIYNIDPDTLTDEYCTVLNKHWTDGTDEFKDTIKVNDDTGMEYHTKANPCKLNDSTVTGLGAKYTDSVLEPQERTTGAVGPANTGAVTQGVDTSAQTCPSDPLITDGGIAEKYGPGRVLQYKIRLCFINGLTNFDVNVSIAQNTANLIRASQAAGLNLSGSGYRTYDEQVGARIDNHCPDIYTSPASACTPDTAKPGESNHESGEAIDFKCNGDFIHNGILVGKRWTAPGNLCWIFLEANARNYGFKPLNSEAWHWSVSGS